CALFVAIKVDGHDTQGPGASEKIVRFEHFLLHHSTGGAPFGAKLEQDERLIGGRGFAGGGDAGVEGGSGKGRAMGGHWADGKPDEAEGDNNRERVARPACRDVSGWSRRTARVGDESLATAG